jgi:Cyclin
MALIYIDRLIQRNGFLLTELNVHRVIVTSILLAAKFFDDAYYNNAYYAKVGGVLVSEMNGLEVDFLFRINFSLHVPPELFHQYRAELLAHCGMDSLPQPLASAPQHDYTTEQHMGSVGASTQPQQDDHEMQHYRQQQQQNLQQQAAALCNGFPMTAAGHPTHLTPQITPSPPRAMAANASHHLVRSHEEDMMVAAVAALDQAAFCANVPSMYTPHEFSFVERANSLPVQTNQSLVSQVHGMPLSAPPIMGMVPEFFNSNFPSLVDAATAAAAFDRTDPMAIVNNTLYHHHQVSNHRNYPHQHHTHRVVMDASDLIHHVHHHPTGHHHHGPGFVSREASVSQRFAAGQMVAGVSGGS